METFLFWQEYLYIGAISGERFSNTYKVECAIDLGMWKAMIQKLNGSDSEMERMWI